MGTWLFRWRSYPPVLVLTLILLITYRSPWPTWRWPRPVVWSEFGLALGATGLAIRAWAVGFAQSGTSSRSTRTMTAGALNTEGLYSVVRHPLYLGNFFLWLGVATISGQPVAIGGTAVLFWLCYRPIMRAEDHFLNDRFEGAFDAWVARTPSFIPRLRSWAPARLPLSLRFWLGRDYHAVYAFVVASSAVALTRNATQGTMRPPPNRAWLSYLAGGTVIFAVLHVLGRLGYTGRRSSSE